MPKVKLNECSHQVAHPSEARRLKVGESAEASDEWVAQHTSLVRRGLIEVSAGKASAPKKEADEQCKAKTRSGKRCKRTATDGDFCATHAD